MIVIIVLAACFLLAVLVNLRGPLLPRSDLEALINATREAKGLTPGRDPQEARERLWHPGCRRCLDELIEIELRAGMAALDKHLKDAL
jgi:hypothetical protein